ncbi:hypothetical protein EPO15_07830 [bacterium]|nr:MAG: hypothetical protein EPO15_07830 [bacterium]
MSRGFILVEASIAYIVLALALVSLMPLFVLSVRANKNAERVAVATHLSTELLEEVRMRRFGESSPVPPKPVLNPGPLGVDAGETASDKATFDDVDDFNAWAESPPSDPVGRPLASFKDYSRTVAVAFVDSGLNAVGGPTHRKRVTVCTTAPQTKPVCLDTLFANR